MLGRVNVESWVSFSKQVVSDLNKVAYLSGTGYSELHAKQLKFEAWRNKNIGKGKWATQEKADELIAKIGELQKVIEDAFSKTQRGREAREGAEVKALIDKLEAFANQNRSKDL